MQIHWEAVTAIVALIGLIAGAFALYVRWAIRVALANFKDDLFRTLNGRYPYSAVCTERHLEIDRRLRAVEGG